ncbi:MAG: head-tail connector protein [Rickettsiales bacterium]|jgi:hypothetical protein|nr:head-tail connector protein [Rickettsiales bacterium]
MTYTNENYRERQKETKDKIVYSNEETKSNEKKELKREEETEQTEPIEKYIGKFKKIKDINLKYIKSKYKIASEVKETWIDRYDQTALFLNPNIEVQDEGKQLGTYQKKDNKIFNTIGVNAANGFVSRIIQMLCPPQSNFIKIECGDAFKYYKKEEVDKINLKLEEYSDILNSIKNTSNFDMVISSFFSDLVLGTACLLVQAGNEDNPLIFQNISFKDYAITEGYQDFIDGVFRKFTVSIEAVKTQWRDIDEASLKRLLNEINYKEDEKEKQIELNFIECTFYDYENNNYNYVVYEESKDVILVSRVYDYNPFIILRWKKSGGDWYGRGVGMEALNDLKTFNKIQEYSLRALSFTLPIILTDRDDVFKKNISLKPGAINPVRWEQGKPIIQTLNMSNGFDIQQFHLDQIKMDVNRTMMNSLIPDETRVRTATEIEQRISEEYVNYTSVFGRLISEFIYKLPLVMLYTLQKAFDIFNDFEIKKLNSYHYRLKITTPLNKQLNQNEIQNTIQTIQILSNLDPSGGLLQKFLKFDDMILNLIDKLGAPKKYIKTADEIMEFEMRQQEAAAQQQQMAMMQQQAEIQQKTAAAQQEQEQEYNY